jgi:methionyl-tRNA formyltransferase
LGPDETIADALAKAEAASLAALRAAMPGLLAGRPAFRPQSIEGTSVFPKRAPADGRLDWNAPAASVHNAIRAQTRPYPGAFAYLRDRKVFAWSSARGPGAASGAATSVPPEAMPEGTPRTPGLVLETGHAGALVACGQGAVRLIDIQFEGEEPAAAGERLAPGDRLA